MPGESVGMTASMYARADVPPALVPQWIFMVPHGLE